MAALTLLVPLALLYFPQENSAAIHSDVVVTGTTVPPGFCRKEAKSKADDFDTTASDSTCFSFPNKEHYSIVRKSFLSPVDAEQSAQRRYSSRITQTMESVFLSHQYDSIYFKFYNLSRL